jgi:hypothetical protein
MSGGLRGRLSVDTGRDARATLAATFSLERVRKERLFALDASRDAHLSGIVPRVTVRNFRSA